MEEKTFLKDESGDRKYFTQIPNIVVNHSTAYEQSLYLIMKKLAGESGSCYASLNFLAKKMGIDKKTVSGTIERLLKRGWIKEIERKKVLGGMVRQFVIVDLWRLNLEHYESGRQIPTLDNESGRQIPTLDNESGRQIPTSEQESGGIFPESRRQTDAKNNQKEEPVTDKDKEIQEITTIFLSYQTKICGDSRLTDSAKGKIKTRLKGFKVDELLKAIENFGGSRWWMEHNARRGIAWFFKSDDRIDQFLNLRPDKATEAKEDKYAKKTEVWKT